MSDDPLELLKVRQRGQPLFALGFVAAAALLALSWPSQTVWTPNTQLFAQPGFWPGVAVAGMLGFGLGHLRLMRRRLPKRKDWFEAMIWARALEYCAWFLAYVFLVPVLGYLPVTLVFLPALVWRLGYRARRMLWTAAAVGAGIVVLFKGLLEVKIPGAAIYDYLPGALRSFFILHF